MPKLNLYKLQTKKVAMDKHLAEWKEGEEYDAIQ